MDLFATTAFPDRDFTYLPALRELAANDRVGEHRLVDDPSGADFVLFLDAHQHPRDLALRGIRRHPLARAHQGRVFLYNELDQPWCALPGLYVSMPRRSFDPRRQRAFPYLQLPNPHVLTPGCREQPPRWLFSFMGRRCHPVRDAVLGLRHPQGFVADTSGTFNALDLPSDDVDERKRRYAEILGASRFVLCPRGAGPSSFRLYEAMAAGRAPVILADDWVAPHGPAWEEFSLRVPEARVGELPALLERAEPRAAAMGARARRAWDEWFAPDVLFHQVVENCRALAADRGRAGAWLPDRRYLYLWAREAKWKVLSLKPAFLR